jgi:hypothetical protein
MTKFHAFLICMDAQDVVVMIFVAKLVISPTYRGPEISAIYRCGIKSLNKFDIL